MAEHTAGFDFIAAVDRVRQERIDESAYLLASARLDEAAQVAPCVSAFARAEILPDDPRPAVGRYADRRVSLSRSIGYLLRKRLTGAGEETLLGLRTVVVEALALAYCIAIDVEGIARDAADDPRMYAIRSDLTAEEIWNWWVVNFVTDVGFDRRFQSEVWEVCHQRVCAGLRELDLLPSIGRRIKLKATTGTYAEVGLLLRVVQSTELIDQDRDSWRHMTNVWPWEEYAA